jgi:hypothetical protein
MRDECGRTPALQLPDEAHVRTRPHCRRRLHSGLGFAALGDWINT